MMRTRTTGMVLLAIVVIGVLATLLTATPGDPDGQGRGGGLYLDNTTVLGDADGDGELSEREQDDLARTEDSAQRVRSGLLPRRGVNTLLVTPAGDDWWRLVTGISAQTATWDAAAPEAAWYAYSESRAYHALDGKRRPYDAIHVAFGSLEAARAWVARGGTEGYTAAASIHYRGRVVTLTPAWVMPDAEPYASVKDVDEELLDGIDVRLGYWQVDFGQQVRMRAEESAVPAAYRRVFANLGFGEDMTWAATSPAPDAVWRGEVTGFESGSVDVADALGAINVSYAYCQAGDPCAAGQQMTEAINMLWAEGGGASGGEPELDTDLAPADADLTVVFGNGWRGAVTGDLGFGLSPVTATEMWFVGDSLAIHPVLGS